MKYSYKLVSALLLESCLKSPAQQSAIKNSNPNSVHILADDPGYGDVSAYNENSKVHTIHIDQLAFEGIRFTDANTSSAGCTPTRYSILTGCYKWRSQLKKSVLSGYFKSLILQNRVTVAEFLKQNGYTTAAIGKGHMGWDWTLMDKDSLGIDNLNECPNVNFTKAVTNGPNAHCFKYSYTFCGSLDMPPYVWVENDMSTMVPTGIPLGKSSQGTWRKGLTSKDFEHEQVLPMLTEKAMHHIKLNGGKEPPLFLYLPLPAPHTPILPNCAYRENKSDVLDGGQRVPYIITWIGRLESAKSNQLVCTTDLFATVAEIIGVTLPYIMAEDSYSSLSAIILSSTLPVRKNLWHHSIAGEFAYRKGDWKVNFYPGSGGWSYPTKINEKAIYGSLPKVQLYKLKTDIAEQHNLAAESGNYNKISKETATING